MKRLLCVFLAVLCLSALLPAALGEDSVVKYQAIVHVKCNLRREPDTAAYRIRTLNEGDKVEILDLRDGDEWCLARYDMQTGYLKTEWLCRFRSLDPFNCPVPGYVKQSGLARATSGLFVSTEDYDGTLFEAGALFAVQECAEDRATIAMARGTAGISDMYYLYQPFAAWEDAREGEVIGGFTTYFNDHFAKKLNSERIFNITVGCERINGVAVAPGEEFSFNALCWPYRKSNGYQYAPNISKEGYGYGGGVCQVSTTLYNCLLGLPLKITKWNVHRDRGVSYARQYFDSAVGNYSDLAFQNTLPYTVVIHALPQNGVLTVYITAGEGAAQPAVSEELLAFPDSGLPKAQVCDPDTGSVPLLDPETGETLITLPSGITVDVIGTDGDQARVRIASHEGIVPENTLYTEADRWTARVKSALLVRSEPSASAKQITRVEKGGTLTVLKTGEGWAYVNAGGYIGYVVSKYLIAD